MNQQLTSRAEAKNLRSVKSQEATTSSFLQGVGMLAGRYALTACGLAICVGDAMVCSKGVN